MSMSVLSAEFVVVGGGVAGVCCVEELEVLIEKRELKEQKEQGSNYTHRIILITGLTGYIKFVTNSERIGLLSESFQINEKKADDFASKSVYIIQDEVFLWNSTKMEMVLKETQIKVRYDKLCIATGASPKHSFGFCKNLMTIRDTDSIAKLYNKITQNARRVLLIGNGGIATELVFELEGVEEVVWAVRDSSISATYFDEAAAKFFAPKINAGRRGESEEKPEVKRDRYTVYSRKIGATESTEFTIQTESNRKRAVSCRLAQNENNSGGCALGPHWLAKLKQKRFKNDKRKIRVLHDTEVVEMFNRKEYFKRLKNKSNYLSESKTQSSGAVFSSLCSGEEKWPLIAQLSTGETLGFDFAIEATGVVPNSKLWASEHGTKLQLADDGGILVNDLMQTSLPNVYAAGDVCTVTSGKEKQHWKQIRLWTQARQMGTIAARSMIADNVLSDICLDLFTHVTTFFGYKVVLLGDFSASKLEKPYEMHYRISRNSCDASTEDQKKIDEEYVKVICKDSKVHGAVLIGETDLEETLENLILNQTNIAQIESELLNPDIDLEDYFD